MARKRIAGISAEPLDELPPIGMTIDEATAQRLQEARDRDRGVYWPRTSAGEGTATLQVEILRGCVADGGRALVPGDVVELAATTATQLVGWGKARLVQ